MADLSAVELLRVLTLELASQHHTLPNYDHQIWPLQSQSGSDWSWWTS